MYKSNKGSAVPNYRPAPSCNNHFTEPGITPRNFTGPGDTSNRKAVYIYLARANGYGFILGIFSKTLARLRDMGEKKRTGPKRIIFFIKITYNGPAGEILHFTGVSDPYEAPVDPDLVIDTDLESVEDSLSKIMECIDEKFTSADGFAKIGAGRQPAYGRNAMVPG